MQDEKSKTHLPELKENLESDDVELAILEAIFYYHVQRTLALELDYDNGLANHILDFIIEDLINDNSYVIVFLMLRSLFYYTGFVTEGYISEDKFKKALEPMYQNEILKHMVKEASTWPEKKIFSTQWD